ncbi:MAG: alpha/beta hydrolase [Clostridia bacterium]|nr:alpha/beta hydrolase [Clostridia bacterium]
MKNKILKISLIILSVIILLILVVPLLIPIEGRVGLNEPEDMLTENSAIVTIPFEGTDGLDIYYEYKKKEGSDKNYILLHGSMYNSKSWSEVMDFFSEKGNVYAYDQLPYGYSEKVLEGEWTGQNPYTTESAIRQLELFMDALDIQEATLVGSSFGGVIAAEAAIRYEDRIENLILVDPAILVTESVPEWLVGLPQVEHLGPLLASILSEGDGFYESTFYNQELMTEERMRYSKRETEINNWNLAMWEYLQAWSTQPSDVSKRLNEIKQPTLVISGENDKIVPLEDSEEIAKLIPNSKMEVISACGHMPHEEQPDKFITILEEWLKELEGNSN